MRSEFSRDSRFRGWLLAGAVGDALGAPVEFMSYDGIVKVFGSEWIHEFTRAYNRIGAIARLTHGHPSGFLAAAVRSQSLIVRGRRFNLLEMIGTEIVVNHTI